MVTNHERRLLHISHSQLSFLWKTTSDKMNPVYDHNGYLNSVREKFTYGRDVVLNRFKGQPFIHIFDNSKCWQKETGVYDKTKGKSISLSWRNAQLLCQTIHNLEHYAKQIEIEEVRITNNILFFFSLIGMMYLNAFLVVYYQSTFIIYKCFVANLQFILVSYLLLFSTWEFQQASKPQTFESPLIIRRKKISHHQTCLLFRVYQIVIRKTGKRNNQLGYNQGKRSKPWQRSSSTGFSRIKEMTLIEFLI